MLSSRFQTVAVLAAALVVLSAPADTDAPGEVPMLEINWRLGPAYPMGIQEPAMGFVGGKVVVAGGFTRSPKTILEQCPDAFLGAPSGFTKLAFAFDPGDEQAGWVRIADFPGIPRQGLATVVVGDAFYAFGGFNYTEPLTYRDGYRLREEEGEWLWETLPCELPFPICEASAVAIGSRIYVFGGADYFRAPGADGADFHAEQGRDGTPVGRALLMLDTENIAAGWSRLADLPGTPRLDCGGAAIGGRLYVLGGVYSPLVRRTGGASYHNVTDCWEYDPAADAWARLPDLPEGSNRRGVAFADRYCLLLGGYKYPTTRGPDGSLRSAHTLEEQALDWKAHFKDDVVVFDAQTRAVGRASKLLDKTSWPTAVAQGSTVYVLGGEGGSGLWHPDTFQIGEVRAAAE